MALPPVKFRTSVMFVPLSPIVTLGRICALMHALFGGIGEAGSSTS
jgi:hypothetical protein